MDQNWTCDDNVSVVGNMSDTSADAHILPLAPSSYRFIALYLTFAGIISTTGNVVVIAVILKDSELRKQGHTILLLNLAISDVGFTVFGYPLTGASSYHGSWLFGNTGCIVYGFICTVLALTDINTLMALSLFRYIVICKPQLNHVMKKRRVSILMAACCWLYSLMWGVAALLGWNRFTYEAFGTSCSIDWQGRSPGDVTYTVLMTVFCYVSHIIVMTYCYHKMTMIMVGTFVTVWSPYAWVCIWTIYDPYGVPAWLTTFPTMFAKASPMINPIIYAATNRRFRRAARGIILRWCCCFSKKVNDVMASAIRNRQTSPVEKRVYYVDVTKDGIYTGKRRVSLPTMETVF